MGLYNFHHRFAPHILDGSKTHTIRDRRKHPDKPGNLCHLYTGLRHKGAQLLGRAPCVRVQEIRIECGFIPHSPVPVLWSAIHIDGAQLSITESEALARRDGFRPSTGSALVEMLGFWEGRLPFQGDLIHWDPEAFIPRPAAERYTLAPPILPGCAKLNHPEARIHVAPEDLAAIRASIASFRGGVS